MLPSSTRCQRPAGKAAALDFRRADFNEVKRIVRETLSSQRGAREEWSFLKETILQAQREVIPTQIKAGRRAQKPPMEMSPS